MRSHRRRQIEYAALATVDTWLTVTGRRRARWLTKPLLMPALARVTVARTEANPSTYVALAGSTIGDAALLRPGPEAFVAGAGAFGVAQLGWLAALAPHVRRDIWRSRSARVVGAGWLVAAPVVALSARKQHAPLGAVLGVYGGSLAAMGVAALNLAPTRPSTARRAAGLGAVLFLVSDGLIGLHQFVLHTDDPRWEAAVMATYTAAQGFLEEGVAGLG